MKRSEVTDFVLEVRVGLLGVELESEEQMLPFVIHIVSNKQETPTIIHAAESEILLKTADKKEQEDNRWMVRLYIYTYIYSPDRHPVLLEAVWRHEEQSDNHLWTAQVGRQPCLLSNSLIALNSVIMC